MGGHSDSVKGFKSPHPYEAVDAAGAALVPRGTVGEGSSGGGRVAVLSKTPTLCLFDVQVGTPAGQATKQKQPSLVVFSGGTAFNSVAGGRNHASAFTGGSCVSNFHHLLNICRSPHASALSSWAHDYFYDVCIPGLSVCQCLSAQPAAAALRGTPAHWRGTSLPPLATQPFVSLST